MRQDAVKYIDIHAQTPELSSGYHYPPAVCVTTPVEGSSAYRRLPRYHAEGAEETVSECFINMAVRWDGIDGLVLSLSLVTGFSDAS